MTDPKQLEAQAIAAGKSTWAKWRLPIIAFVLGILAGVGISHAAGTSATLSWTMPNQYVDTTPLPLSDIGITTITWTRPGSASILGSVNVNAPATTVVVPGLACGNFSFTATVTTTSTAAQPNATSDPTNPASYATGINCKPNPPTGLTAN